MSLQGHISTINCVRFLPASNNEQMISCGSDRQVWSLAYSSDFLLTAW